MPTRRAAMVAAPTGAALTQVKHGLPIAMVRSVLESPETITVVGLDWPRLRIVPAGPFFEDKNLREPRMRGAQELAQITERSKRAAHPGYKWASRRL